MSFKINSWCIFTIFLICLVAGCSEEQTATLERAQQYENEGNLIAATVELKSVLAADPNNPDIRFILGRLYNAQFDPASAEKELTKALELGLSDDGTATLELAQALLNQGKHEALLEQISPESASSASRPASILALRGRAYYGLGNSAEAERNLALALAAEPDNPEAGLLDAQIKIGQRDVSGSLDALERVLIEAPMHVYAWTYKADLLRATGKPLDALAAYEQVLTIHPSNFHALIRRSMLLVSQGELDAAQETIALLEKSYPEQPKTHVQTGILQLTNGKPRAALDSARRALAGDPDLADANLLAGLASNAIGSLLQADEYLTRFVAAVPNSVFGRRTLAETLFSLNEPARALAVIQPILDSTVEDARVYNLAGAAHRALGNQQESVQWFDKATTVIPGYSDAKINRALATMRSGEVDSGLDELADSVALMSGASQADEILIVSLLSRGDVERAASSIAELEQRAPDSPITLNMKGAVLLAQGDLDAARRAFEKTLEREPQYLPAAQNLVQLDIAAGDIDAARSRYQRIIDLNEKHVAAMLALADLDERLGNKDEAISLVKRAVRVDPDARAPAIKLIRLYLDTGNTQPAVDMAERALAQTPDDAALIELTAQSLSANGNQSRADNTIRELLNVPPVTAETYIRVAEFQFAARLPGEAEKTLRRALKKYPSANTPHFKLVSMLVDLRRTDDALAHARAMQSDRPAAPIGYLVEGEVLEHKREFAQAQALYETALELQPAGQIALKRFFAQRRAGDPDGAQKKLEQWVEAYPDDYWGRSGLADALLAQNDFANAAKHYEILMQAKYGTLGTVNSLAWAYYKLGDERALGLAEIAQRSAPRSAYAADTLGWILVEQGDVPRGLDYLRRAVVMAPNQAEIRYHLGSALVRAGEVEAGRAELSKIVQAEGTSAVKERAQTLLDTLN